MASDARDASLHAPAMSDDSSAAALLGDAPTEDATSQIPSSEDGSGAADSAAPSAAEPAGRLDDLAEIIRSYNAVTEKLQQSHEALQHEVVRLQKELAGKNAQLQRSKRLAALGEMAAGIAHEIRNPLAAIHLYARMVVEDLEAATVDDGDCDAPLDETRETATKIASAVRGLNAVVNDVLSFARELQPRVAATEVDALFSRAIDAHRPAIDANGVRVVCAYEENKPLAAHVDADLMHQALLNLIRNAVEAMSSAGGTLTLGARAADDSEQIVLAVRDTGPGIAQADIDRIFNPFFTTRNSGTGLGLAIVHRIVDAHGGSIAVYNDGGAVFELTVPAARPLATFASAQRSTRNSSSQLHCENERQREKPSPFELATVGMSL